MNTNKVNEVSNETKAPAPAVEAGRPAPAAPEEARRVPSWVWQYPSLLPWGLPEGAL